MRDIGKNIKDLRQRKKLTQEELAERLFVTRQTVSNYELGRTRPDIDMLVRIAEVLDISIETIIYGTPHSAHKRLLKKLTISIITLLCVYFLYEYLFTIGQHIKQDEYYVTPVFWLEILLRPILYILLGWITAEILNIFKKIPTIPLSISKLMLLSVSCLLGIYLVVMLPYLLLDIWPWSIPKLWSYIVYYLLNAFPNRICLFNNSFIGFITGICFWLMHASSSCIVANTITRKSIDT